MSKSQSVPMPGQVWGLAASDTGGPIFITTYDGKNVSTTLLTAIDVTGEVLWRREFDGHPSRPRVSASGSVWVAHRGPTGAVLTELDAAGLILRSITPEHEPFERLGSFAVLSDGVCVSWLPAERNRAVPAGRHARIARHGEDGSVRWSTPAVLDQLSFPGCVEISTETSWEVRPAKPWAPQTIEAHHWEPLLVAGHRIAATFADGRSGIAVTFFLDTATGRLVAASRPGPSHHKAIVGPGEFLIGSQGYGAFTTARYDSSGAVVQEWSTHAMLLIDRHGGISGPESENVTPSRSRFVSLDHDGTVHRGPALPGYYTTYPALDAEGTAVFWRDGRLLAVDADFQIRELFALEDEKRAVMSKIMLLDHGQLAFALHDELFILRSTGLGPLDSGVWPCADGGLHGNPVTHQ
ncbi:hypothetical protein [Streptomyces sp. NBC_00385]|uniref:hypothetical protein n=1 Tax=Streptomyces sp. NBC_00385 TaxID=2975733 RepID=UPI002DDAFBD0|nr:hypothetical protein [Streptomyces sp. NBC_00385]WRZ06905.1 hypothetical protein OG959_28005 [Streptomyces sp. NBC_00385]